MNFFVLAVLFSGVGIAAHLARATAIDFYVGRGMARERAVVVHAWVSLAFFIAGLACMGAYIVAES